MTGAEGRPAAGGRMLAVVAATVLAHPALWPAAVVTAWRLTPPGWWRRWPPLPRPDPAYMAFRMQTAYGDASAPPEPADVIAYLRWCRRQTGAGRYG